MSLIRIVVGTLTCLLIGSIGNGVQADVKLPPFFSDHMVLQRDGKAPLWGTAVAGEKVTVRFRDQQRQATADATGNWRVEFHGLKAGGPDELIVGGYVNHDPALAKLASQTYPQIRGCTAERAWTVSSAEANRGYSALLFPMAVRLHEELDVPVGMMLGAVEASVSLHQTRARSGRSQPLAK